MRKFLLLQKQEEDSFADDEDVDLPQLQLTGIKI